MRKFAQLLVIISIFIILSNVLSARGETDPYTIYGIVRDEDGAEIAGAVITVTNENTNEKNTVGEDTITGNPVPVTTDSDGKYTFEITNLKNGYEIGDEIFVTAEKEGVVGTNTIFIEEGSWGSEVDITVGASKNRETDQGSNSDLINWILFLMQTFVIIVILFFIYKRYKSNKITRPEMEGTPPKREVRKKLPPPPPGWKQKKDIISNKEEKEEQVKKSDDDVILECPICGYEIEVDTTICPICKSGLSSDEENKPPSYGDEKFNRSQDDVSEDNSNSKLWTLVILFMMKVVLISNCLINYYEYVL